jgi:hypothetical protein
MDDYDAEICAAALRLALRGRGFFNPDEGQLPAIAVFGVPGSSITSPLHSRAERSKLEERSGRTGGSERGR